MSFAVFLDRDGTIVVDKHHLSDPEGLELLPNAGPGLRMLRDLDARLVVVTNQSGVGRGFFDEATVVAVNQRLEDLLAAEEVELTGIYVCPHAPEDRCDCRKPASELYRRAAREHGLDLGRSFVVGDSDADVEAGRRVGATSIRIGTAKAPDELAAPDLVAASLLIQSRCGRAG